MPSAARLVQDAKHQRRRAQTAEQERDAARAEGDAARAERDAARAEAARLRAVIEELRARAEVAVAEPGEPPWSVGRSALEWLLTESESLDSQKPPGRRARNRHEPGAS